MWDCGSPPESAEHTSHEPKGTIQKDSSKNLLRGAAELLFSLTGMLRIPIIQHQSTDLKML